ncbi:hypothetical protein Tco_0474061, partial [Tanacetum coccineum]
DSLFKMRDQVMGKKVEKSIREGLAYITDVEKNLNATDDYIRTQKAAKKLWEEVDIHRKWLGNNLKKHAQEVNAAAKILRWLNDTAKNNVSEEQTAAPGEMAELLNVDHNADKLPQGKLSTKGVGATATDMSEAETLEDGVVVPLV